MPKHIYQRASSATPEATTSEESIDSSSKSSHDEDAIVEMLIAIERGARKAQEARKDPQPRSSDDEIADSNKYFLNRNIDENSPPNANLSSPNEKSKQSQTAVRAPVSLFYGEREHVQRLSPSTKQHAKSILRPFG